MTWVASVEDMQSALDGRFVDLQSAVQSAMTAVNCYTYAEAIDAFNRLVKLAEEARDLYEKLEDASLARQGEELDKHWQELIGKEE